MGQDVPCSWASLKRPLWQCLNPLDSAANSMRLQLQQQDIPGSHHLHPERWVFTSHMNPMKQQQQQQQHRQAAGFVLPSALGISSLVMPQVNPALSMPIVTSTDVHAGGGGGGAGQERKFLIFDQSGSRTTMIFSSVSPALQLNGTDTTTTTTTDVKPASMFQGDAFLSDVVVNKSDGTTSVSQGSKRDGVNGETDNDIDALLYSDSEEEEGNTGPCSSSPDMVILGAAGAQVEEEEEVASSCGPSKRRRVDEDEEKVMHDEALIDTAASSTTTKEVEGGNVVVVAMATGSSTTCGVEHAGTNRDADDDSDRSSCVKGDSSSRVVPPKWAGADPERNPSAKAAGAGGSNGMWKLKRDHIRETVNVLRGIIPGCKGKDTCLVLDEAIRYLKSLELKVQTLGGTL